MIKLEPVPKESDMKLEVGQYHVSEAGGTEETHSIGFEIASP